VSEGSFKGPEGLEALRLDKGSFGKRSKRKRWVVPGVIGLIVVATGAFFALRDRAAGPTVETLTVPPPGRPDGEVMLTATGYVVARRKAAVGPKIPGRVSYLGVEEGSVVKQGDVIARLESSDLAANVDQAAARLRSSEAALAESEAAQVSLDLEANRRSVLFDQGLGSKNEADVAAADTAAGRARVRGAADRISADRAALAYAQATLENTIVKAPFDGVVLTKDADLGESVAPAVGGGGTTRGSMVTMADMASLEVEADVGESSIAKIEAGGPAEIVLDAFPDTVYPAVVHQIVPTADRQKATVQVKVRFTGDMAGALPEMSAKVNFLAKTASPAESPARVMTLPASAVRKTTNGWAVLKVEDGIATEVPVVLAREPAKGKAEVASGLSGGEEILAAPPANVTSGSRVRVADASSGRS
jgi:RND family efflux transporter MFP subunit